MKITEGLTTPNSPVLYGSGATSTHLTKFASCWLRTAVARSLPEWCTPLLHGSKSVVSLKEPHVLILRFAPFSTKMGGQRRDRRSTLFWTTMSEGIGFLLLFVATRCHLPGETMCEQADRVMSVTFPCKDSYGRYGRSGKMNPGRSICRRNTLKCDR